MDIIFEPEISLEKSLILFANYFQFDFGIRLGLMNSERRLRWTESVRPIKDLESNAIGA